MSTKNTFAGDKKIDNSWLIRLEERVVAKTIRFVPIWLETYHLTAMTILWSIGVIVAGYLARTDIGWLWFTSLFIFLQYITDLYDGKVGKARNTGLIKWGYYMDHFLDYIFLCSIVIGYFFLAPAGYAIYFLALLGIFGGFMVNSFLSFAATNELKIEYFGVGPTNVRFGFIALNTYMILVSPMHVIMFSPFIVIIAILALSLVVFRTQKYIWKIDMDEKEKKDRI